MEAGRWKLVSIVLSIALIISLIYILSTTLLETEYETSTTTTPYTSNMTATPLPYTSIPVDMNYTVDFYGKVREIASVLKDLEFKGYDVYYIEYLVLSAAYHYSHGYREKAYSLLEQAVHELEHVELLPELPKIDYSIVDNTLYLKHAPSEWDFVPLGTVFTLSSKGYLVYPRNDPMWKLSCFILIAIGYNEEDPEDIFMYQGRLPLIPREASASGFRPRVYINGRWVIPESIRFVGPLYYDSGEKYSYPTVYEQDLSGRYLEYLTYIPSNRTWIHRIVDVVDNRVLLDIKAEAIGAPMWLGEWNSSYIVHGVYAKERGVDLWSGFWDVCRMEARVYIGGVQRVYCGVFIVDRASHRVHGVEHTFYKLGLPLAFSCIVVYQEDLDIMITSSSNPSPWGHGYSMEHQLRINLFNQGIVVDVTNFTLVDDGGLQPKTFYLYGVFSNGYINITGVVVNYWPEEWIKDRGVWWDGDGVCSWGRAFIHWTGEIVVDERVWKVDAIGAGEFTRYSNQYSGECSNSDRCWCR